MRILLTGASGYVGSAALRTIEARGHQALVLQRQGSPTTGNHEYIQIELSELEKLTQLAATVDAVIHCAASDHPDFWPVSQKAAMAMLEGLGRHGAFAAHGGSMVFGDTGSDATEKTLFNPPPPLVEKANLDRSILQAAGDGLRTYLVYGSLVYGGDRRAVIPSVLISTAIENSCVYYVGDGLQLWSSVHVDDFGALLVDAVENGPSGGTALFAAGAAVTMKSVAKMVAEELNLDVRSIGIQEAMDRYGMFGAAFGINQHFSAKQAVEVCGWQPDLSKDPVALKTAIKELVNQLQ